MVAYSRERASFLQNRSVHVNLGPLDGSQLRRIICKNMPSQRILQEAGALDLSSATDSFAVLLMFAILLLAGRPIALLSGGFHNSSESNP